MAVTALKSGVFIIPGEFVKNGDERLVVLNSIAHDIVIKRRGKCTENVFTYKGEPITQVSNSAWLRARKAEKLKQVRVHGLKHTFGRRSRAAGVSFEDRQDLLGHRSGGLLLIILRLSYRDCLRPLIVFAEKEAILEF